MVLMVVDAALTFIGLNYFTVIIPKIEEFNKKFVKSERIRSLKDLVKSYLNELREVRKDKKS